jgi:hypothetical protein
MTTITSTAVIAIVAALALLGAVAVTVFIIQIAEARGCINPNAPAGGSIAANASKGRCVR